VPCSRTSFAALSNPVIAARYSEVARLMRLTPAADRAATVNDLPLIPTMKLNGLVVAAHTARTDSKSGSPGAMSASAPAAAYAFSLIVSSRSGRPRRKLSAVQSA